MRWKELIEYVYEELEKKNGLTKEQVDNLMVECIEYHGGDEPFVGSSNRLDGPRPLSILD